ncbi:MAG: hypothetical protein A2896_00860 [Candidatus Nealsonbacteria bacterium RIFCSPLOWO2_01_FULL_43_32]|uniref:Uncharacterized protein n=1 Tax=Candidatus Nealsonbacteria bacterium RIFCSPLOWO2_01_FULL_43_32 TaxID=1801672 RepID=A0A1G2EDA4_9BACT|nr:MAG: hypothetical protein A2896_00860 [Candidatus Nealsonbacteria bacterium RIFCSPLOWO2_01_FULL_43_32]
MAEFYHELITEKSFKTLQELRKKFKFILIGGWAVFLYTKSLKSKDIDMVIDYDELGRIKKAYALSKNDRLKKYEIKSEGIDVDIYLPYFSDLGLKAEQIQNYCQNIEGFLAPIPEVLLILKVYAYGHRRGTNKGRKDLIDIFSLLKNAKIDWPKYQELIKKYALENLNEDFKNLVSSARAVPELKLLNHQIARLKKDVLKNLQ